jgi:hypothetical protein
VSVEFKLNLLARRPASALSPGRTPTVVGADVFAREQQIATMLATMIGR